MKDSREVFALGTSRKALAVAAVALMMVVTIAPMLINQIGGEPTDNSTTVIYHSYYDKPTLGNGHYITNATDDGYSTSYIEYNVDTGSEQIQTMSYYGAVWSTEYNPQLWTTGPGNIEHNWYPIIKYSSGAFRLDNGDIVEAGRTLIFMGWKTAVYDSEGALTGISDVTYYPGEVIPESVQEQATKDGSIHVYATWGYLNYTDAEDIHRYNMDGTVAIDTVRSNNGNVTVNAEDTVSNVYSNIVSSIETYISVGNCTIDPTIKEGADRKYDIGGNTVWMNDDLIIQNSTITGSLSGSNHGGNKGGGLFAQGHVLIIGLGMTGGTASDVKKHLQIFGGMDGSTVSGNITRSTFEGETDTLATMVIIHSGAYSNVIGGSINGTLNGSTYLSIRGATVLDTLTGGCSSSSGWINGSSFVYATNMNMPGDTYEEKNLGTDMGNFNGISAGYVVSNESTILTGASINGTITGDTHVYISGTTAVWDVQAAGRGGNSKVLGTANLNISGKSVVKHAACGSITDGISYNEAEYQRFTEDKQCVKTVNISIHDDARVAAVFGAGYDTFYKATYVSMYGKDSSINLNIDGGVVGYVYGGGYRGTVGTEKDPLDHVTINISGGRIVGDVFLGGRGGLDKVCHDINGKITWGVSYTDTTGYSVIYSKSVNLNISGGMIEGNVYGGGESVPVIGEYDGNVPSSKYGTMGDFNEFGTGKGTASIVTSSLSINIENATIYGSIFGAGKGVDNNALDSFGRHESAYIFTMNDKGNVIKIPWIAGTTTETGTTIIGTVSDGTYMDYASVIVNGSMSVSIKDSFLGRTSGNNIYGGGALGELTVSREYRFNIADSESVGSVYGGGKGSSANSDIASADVGSMTLRITGSGGIHTISGSVYGGGELSKLTSANPLVIHIERYTVGDSVYGGGKGTDTVGKEDWAIVKAPSVEISVSKSEVKGSIYGGGALGRIDCTTATVGVYDETTVGDSVYGGGKGSESNIDSARITGSDNINVIISNGLISGSVYGGGKMSSVKANNITVSLTNQSTVNGSVFGGGQGISGKTEWALAEATDIDVNIDNSLVNGSVYGGGRLSRTEGTINVTIGNNSTVRGTVYGGGLGSMEVVSTVGSRTVRITNAAIRGSVFGSSSLGNDNGGDSRINIGDGTSIESSVYGGGFKGKLTGNTEIVVNGTVDIGFSIYGGADIGDVTGDSFDKTLVIGRSSIEITGEDVSIGRSIFGSGNSCKVDDGDDSTLNTIYIEGFGSGRSISIESIQSADKVDILRSDIILSGRSDASMSQASTKYSLNHIKELNLHDGTTVDLRASVGDLHEYGSYVASTESTVETPSNTIILNNGIIFSVMDEDGTYGLVHGYTFLSKNAEDTYGAYAYGSIATDENSGFCIHEDGQFVKLEPSIFEEQKCKCWFLRGTLTYDVTAVAKHGNGSTTVTSVIPVSYTSTDGSKESIVIFAGATPVVLRNGSMELVDGDFNGTEFSNKGNLTDSSKFGLVVGTGLSGNMTPTMTFGSDGNGINALRSPQSYDDYENYTGTRNGMPIVSFTLFYNSQQEYTGYIGYVLLHFIEANQDEEGKYHTYNEIVIRLAIHTEGDTDSFMDGNEYSMNIVIDQGSGTQTFSIPRSFKDYSLVYNNSSISERDAFDTLYFQTVANEGRTFGWNNPMSSPVLMSSMAEGSVIDSLKGTHAAAMQFSFDKCEIQSALIVKMYFTLVPDTDGMSISFSINITVQPVKSYNVTFHPENGKEIVISVNDGDTIHSTLIPSTGKYFVGWFTDSAHSIRYDFNTPVTNDLELYADYKFTITFVHGNGIVSTFYVAVDTKNGSTVYKPEDPVRYGFEFANWVNGDKICFKNNYEIVFDDTEYTAVWKGTAVEVTFGFENTLTAEQLEDLRNRGFVFNLLYDFGTTYECGYYMSGDQKVIVDFEDNTAILKKYLNDKNLGKFIRWGLYDNDDGFLGTYVYSDMNIQSTSAHKLKAQIDDTALLMSLNGNKPSDLSGNYPDPSINAPVKSLLYGNNGTYVLSPSSGSLKGFTLIGWTYRTDSGSGYISNGSSKEFNLIDGKIYDGSGNIVLYEKIEDEKSEFDGALCITLYAEWSQIDYTLTIVDPLGTATIDILEIRNYKGDAVSSSATTLHYGDTVKLKYNNNDAPYTFSQWSYSGDCSVVSEDGETIVLVINGFATVSARQGGMYGVELILMVDDKITTSYNVALNNSENNFALKVVDGKYVHNLIPNGTYDVMIEHNGLWYAVEKTTVNGDTMIDLPLFTITLKVNGYENAASCPPFAKTQTNVTIDVDEGYMITESNIALDSHNGFFIDGPTDLEITVNKKTFIVTIKEREEGTFTLYSGNDILEPDNNGSGVLRYEIDYGLDIRIVFESKEWHVFVWMVNGVEALKNNDEMSIDSIDGDLEIITILKSHGGAVDVENLGTYTVFTTCLGGYVNSDGKYTYTLLMEDRVSNIEDTLFKNISFGVKTIDSHTWIEMVSETGPLAGMISITLSCNDGLAKITLNVFIVGTPASAGDNVSGC